VGELRVNGTKQLVDTYGRVHGDPTLSPFAQTVCLNPRSLSRG